MPFVLPQEKFCTYFVPKGSLLITTPIKDVVTLFPVTGCPLEFDLFSSLPYSAVGMDCKTKENSIEFLMANRWIGKEGRREDCSFRGQKQNKTKGQENVRREKG
jgi:hypothetical protein